MYDPAESPRHLATVVEDEEYDERESMAEARMQQIIDACNAQVAMFESRGWQFTALNMQHEIAEAEKFLSDPRKGETMEDINLVRGQLMAWKILLNQPELVKQQRDFYITQLRQRQHARS